LHLENSIVLIIDWRNASPVERRSALHVQRSALLVERICAF